MNNSPFLAAFNAKVMSYEDIATTFVASEKFRELSVQANSILLGPRGSGKTTLMKMLSVEGQRAWRRIKPDSSAESINYSGIYVPADKAWASMVASLSESLGDDSLGQLVSDAAFATNIFQAVVGTVTTLLDHRNETNRQHSHLFRSIETSALEKLVADFADIWRLKPLSLSLRGIERALGLRLLSLQRQVRLITTYPPESRATQLRDLPFIGLPALDCVAQALTQVNALTDRQDGHWALLLDEFEIAPKHLQATAMDTLRGGKAPLIIKMALAPCGGHVDVLRSDGTQRPDSINDLRRVELWYADKERAASFSRAVFMAVEPTEFLSRRPEDVVGKSMFDVADSDSDIQLETDENSRSEAEKKWLPYFRTLAKRDSNFSDYIRKKEIDLEVFDTRPSAPHGNLLRKIAPIVAFRAAYRTREGTKLGRADFKGPYSGWDAIIAICEGNPRWLKGLMGLLTSAIQTSETLPISNSVQASKIFSLAEAYTDMLKTVATDDMGIHTSQSVFGTLEKIGSYFYDRTVLDPFTSEIPMSFIVDDDVDDDTELCLRIALNHGAIICYDNADSSGGFRSLRNKTFRLSYMVAPIFRLPLRKGKVVELSGILKTPTVKALPAPSPQIALEL